ncbi:hypothetical protein ACFSC4_31215 [Deinococcus malanensis]|uniref:hypothetical protein n=1 Tax=Deinococcus malanensis TaxID=1706855 RepID=UPI00362D5913
MPGAWDVDSKGVKELRRYLADEWSGTVRVQSTPAPLSSPLILPAGVWSPGTWRLARRDIELILLPQAFFNLECMEVS